MQVNNAKYIFKRIELICGLSFVLSATNIANKSTIFNANC